MNNIACSITVSKHLEKIASLKEKKDGLDIADFLVYRDPSIGWALTTDGYPMLWDQLDEKRGLA